MITIAFDKSWAHVLRRTIGCNRANVYRKRLDRYAQSALSCFQVPTQYGCAL